jgi:hypothetical protein
MASRNKNRLGQFGVGARGAGGVALIVTLVLIALITITVLIFFVQVAGNTKVEADRSSRSEVDLLARSACNYVINLLASEILDPANSSSTVSGNLTIYQPKANTNAIPMRAISPNIAPTDANFANLIRQSIPSTDANASSDSTSTAAQNGSLISTNTWNAPSLLGGGGFANANQLPNWIYMTANTGPANTAGAPNIIGRFSYNVYDTSGLLDANVAGAPGAIISSLGPTLKGTLAGTDLVQLGLGLTQADNDTLMNFRNSSAVQNTTTYTNWLAASSASGFLSSPVTNSDTGAVYTNNFFVGRQDLIRYTNQCPSLAGLLPYLTTFSREKSGPSWSPSADLGKFAYKSQSTAAGSTNRFLPTVPVRTAFVRADGTKAIVGEPLIKERFPLSRLSLLVNTPPSAANAANILLYFGLTWDSVNERWIYDHGARDSGGNNTAIYTLDQVASLSQSREPDFFEMLKAVILSGSLGQDPGDVNPTTYAGEGGPLGGGQGATGALFTERYSVVDRHVVQVGVNILDQWKPSNYPSAIYFQSYSGLADPNEKDLYNTLFGVKDLPYLTQIDTVISQIDSAQTRGWLRPEIWNPHLSPAGGDPPGPTNFRIRAYNECFTTLVQWATPDGGASGSSQQIQSSETVNYDWDTSSGNTSCIYFSAQSADFRDTPQFLKSTTSGLTTTPNNRALINVGGTTYDFAGFYAGTIPNFNWMQQSGLQPNSSYFLFSYIAFNYPMDFILEYRAADGTWRPYNYISNLDRSYSDPRTIPAAGPVAGTRPGYTVDSAGNLNLPQTTALTSVAGDPNGDESDARVDPRTDRFSLSMGSIGTAGTSAQFLTQSSFQWGSTPQMANPVFDSWPGNGNTAFAYQTYALVPGSPSQRLLGELVANVTSSHTYYTDADGVLRPGDAWKQNPTTGDGCLLFPGKSADACRPTVLSRPFNSVAELGYAFRDLPFKSIDFDSTSSADAGLLDAFCLDEVIPTVAGRVNPSRAPLPVLQAMLTGGAKDSSQTISSSEADMLAAALQANMSNSSQGPIVNRADMAARLSTIVDASSLSTADTVDKAYREAPVRTIVTTLNTRTWNLLIDVIAQTGKMSTTAPSGGSFIVQGQRHYWLHVAIDRYTGEIVDELLEPVYE